MNRSLRTQVVALSVIPFFACSGDALHDLLFGPSHPIQEAPPLPAPTPVPPALPVAAPTPAPGATPTPCPGTCPDVPSNTAPIARVYAKVFFIECASQAVPGSEGGSVPIGCRVHYDATPKDASNQPTRARGVPYWAFTPEQLVRGGDPTSFTPAVTAVGVGTLAAQVFIDGVASNVVTVEITP